MRAYMQATEHERKAVADTIARKLKACPEVVLAFLFGSFADQPRFRDIDVGVLLNPDRLSGGDAAEIVSQLVTGLEWEIGYPLDMIVLNDAPIALRYAIARGQLLVCSNAEEWHRFREETWRDYFDFEPFLRASLRDLLSDA